MAEDISIINVLGRLGLRFAFEGATRPEHIVQMMQGLNFPMLDHLEFNHHHLGLCPQWLPFLATPDRSEYMFKVYGNKRHEVCVQWEAMFSPFSAKAFYAFPPDLTAEGTEKLIELFKVEQISECVWSDRQIASAGLDPLRTEAFELVRLYGKVIGGMSGFMRSQTGCSFRKDGVVYDEDQLRGLVGLMCATGQLIAMADGAWISCETADGYFDVVEDIEYESMLAAAA